MKKKAKKTKKSRLVARPAKRAEKSKRVPLMPLGDRVVVEPAGAYGAEHQTDSGIIIPETVDKERPERGTVIAVGPGKYEDGKLIPMRVKVGQKVLFSKYGPDEIKIGDKDYLIVSESSILAVID